MKTLALVYAILLNLSACASVPITGTVIPVPGIDAKCLALQPDFEKWQSELGIKDWTIYFGCDPKFIVTRADGMVALGLTSVDNEERRVYVWIHPEAPDPKEIVVHELLHVVLTFVRAANSEMVEEQYVRQFVRIVYKPNPPRTLEQTIGAGPR